MSNCIATPVNNKRMFFLDLLRIFAFVSVLIGHKFYSYLDQISIDPTVHATPKFILKILLPLFYGGAAGVLVFFLVSGYIIAHVLQTERTGEFLIKRIFRIYPLYIFAVISQYSTLLFTGRAPELSVLLPQLLLIGDFFGTPYSLNGVEWTLRLEVAFYLFMAVIHSFMVREDRRFLLPYIFVCAVFLCWMVSPIPNLAIWSHGYFTIYAPFLLLGSIFCFYEKRFVGIAFLVAFSTFDFLQYFILISTFQKDWLNSNFAILAFGIFLIAWRVRKNISVTPLIIIVSEMTYAVYLFHNWLFDYLKILLSTMRVSIFNQDIQALLVLMLVCFAMVFLVEKPGIRIGKIILKKFQPRLALAKL